MMQSHVKHHYGDLVYYTILRPPPLTEEKEKLCNRSGLLDDVYDGL